MRKVVACCALFICVASTIQLLISCRYDIHAPTTDHGVAVKPITRSGIIAGSSSEKKYDGTMIVDDDNVETFHSAVRFVFIVGLEGTGHHTMGAIIRDSPASDRLRDLGIIPKMVLDLGLSLFNDDTSNALWNAHCKAERGVYGGMPRNQALQARQNRLKQSFPNNTRRRRRLKRLGYSKIPTSAESGPNVVQYLDKVVRNMESIHHVLQTKNAPGVVTPMVINAWQQQDVAGFNNVGALSYPNFRGDCRKLNWANLDLLYQACNKARVDCEHVYIYRDPYAVLRSTNRRGMHKTMLEALHLYISHLNIIISQLLMHPQRTAGCWGVLDVNATWEEVWTPIYRMFGWKEREEFEKYLEQVFKPPSPVTENDKETVAPAKFEPYVRSLYQAHNKAIGICRASVDANRK